MTILVEELLRRDPIDLAFGPDGRLWVSAVVFDEGLAYWDPASGSLRQYRGLSTQYHISSHTITEDNILLFADPTESNIGQIDLGTGVVTLLLEGSANPRALTIGPEGALYYPHPGHHAVHSLIKVIPDGGTEEIELEEINAPIHDLVYDPMKERFLIVSGGRLFEMVDMGSVRDISPRGNIFRLGFNPHTGELAYSLWDSNAIYGLSTDGSSSGLLASIPRTLYAAYPEFAPDGHVFVGCYLYFCKLNNWQDFFENFFLSAF